MPTFYLAGRTRNMDLIKDLARSLEAYGMAWSYDWTAHPIFPKPYGYGDPEINRFTEACMEGARSADLFVLLAKDSLGARGSLIELGLALSGTAEIWIIDDEDPSLFSCLDRIRHAATVEELLERLA